MNAWELFWRNTGTVLRNAFLAPPYLWFLAIVPIIVLLYLLKLRRTQVVIASTLLWMKTLEDLTANAPFQRLRKNLLLLLQIIIALLIAFALARPFIKTQGAAGQNLCVLIDRSASMQTREGEQTRLDLAKQQAVEMVNAMQRGDKMMVLSFAENSDVLCELTEDRSRLRGAIASIEPSDTATRLRDAFFVAHSLRLTVADLHAVVISDGNIHDLAEIGPREFGQSREVADQSTEARSRGYDLSFLQVGSTNNNVGITEFSKREPVPGASGEQQALVAVQNAGAEMSAVTVTLSFNDQPLAVEGVEIAPGETRELVFAHPELGEGILKAVLDSDDALMVDNTAWLSLRPAAKLRVLLVAQPDATGTYFLQRVLAPDPRVELSTIAPVNYTPTAGYDLTVFYDHAPDALPEGTLLFIKALPPIEGLVSEGTIENPPVVAVDAEHPLMRFNLNPANVGIQSAVKAVLPEGSRPVVSTTGGALIADVSRGGQQIVWIAFDLTDSDWPLNLSFPLFFQNVLAWAPRSALASESSVDAGRPITLIGQSDVAAAVITRPDGTQETVPLDPLRPVFYSNTQQAGVYTAQLGDNTERFAVNLLDPAESAVAPSDALAIGRGDFEAERGNVRQNREYWRALLVVALCVLALEWLVFSRRAWM
ncbi:MAG: BatA and WFA domain-containing protein [Candidatus Hydrogenedentes bacterium]|nr:BatA and WFA domain-containing protein [Candidatus Hydrogenedentota bacterium]